MSKFHGLIVEDSKMMRQMLAQALSRIPGMTVVEADNGFEGMRALASRTFDIVLTDINMPIMDGLKFVRHVRTTPQHAKVPIIIISTEAAPMDRDRALTLGANAYIQKPIQAPEVLRTVQKLLKFDDVRPD
jgi:two-component system chemotaxis response regulator CheY